ncbi:MAG: ABC transporter ATP-binding protein [Candidatus Peribacteria bacterium]|nr:MAG: ABC transporter ATP-binding protein [Candidatus Peribacteria bacterium]
MSRLWEPVRAYPRLYGWAVFVAASYFSFDLYTILILQKLAGAFQSGDLTGVKMHLIIYTVVFFIMYLRKYIVRDAGWVTIKRFVPKYLREKYFEQYIKLDNTAVEKVGTGRLINIINE